MSPSYPKVTPAPSTLALQAAGLVKAAKPAGRKAKAAEPEAPVYNVYSRHCPARFVLDRLADKWALLVIGRIRHGAVRFNQLRRDVDGVSQKVLAQTLRRLERDGLIARQAFATVPVTVEYSLTELGQTLADTIETLSRWAESHMDTVLAAQQRYDRINGAVAA